MYASSSFWCCPWLSTLRLNCLLSLFASVFFFSGWWIFIGLWAEFQIDGTYVLPGLFASVALVVINIIPASIIQDPHSVFYNNYCAILCTRTLFLVGFMIAFGTLIGASYILFSDFLLNKDEPQKWPGWAIFLQNICIFLAAVLLRMRRPHDFY